MRKLRNFYLSLIAVASLGFMSSCGDDNDDPTPTPTPVEDTNTYTAKILGAQENASKGSFLATTDGSIMDLATAKQNAAKVDLVYFFGATNAATIAAPSDQATADVFNAAASPTNNMTTWSKRNNTMFKPTTAAVYTGITNSASLATAYTNTGGETTKVNQLKVDDYFLFKTEPGKIGIAKVVAIKANSAAGVEDSEITIDVKVQK